MALLSGAFDKKYCLGILSKLQGDFEQAELFLCFDGQCALLMYNLHLIVADCPLRHSVTMRSAKDFHTILSKYPRLEACQR